VYNLSKQFQSASAKQRRLAVYQLAVGFMRNLGMKEEELLASSARKEGGDSAGSWFTAGKMTQAEVNGEWTHIVKEAKRYLEPANEVDWEELLKEGAGN